MMMMMMVAEAMCEATLGAQRMQPRPKPTVSIDHIGPVDDHDAWVRRSATSNTAIVASS